jgi:hypothetical protein
MTRTLWLLFGYTALGLAIAGAALPLLPTTPFLLVAAYAFARSSPRLHRWLLDHKQFGPLIDNWNRHGAISVKAKASALFAMTVTFAASWYWGAGGTILVAQALLMAVGIAFIFSRPSGPGPDA